MNEQALVDALDQSIQWLQEGRSVSDCLQAYPELADQLAPMLETGIAVRRAQIRSTDMLAAQDRVRLQVQARRQRRAKVNLLTRSIAAIVVVTFAALLIWQAPRISTVLGHLQGTTTSIPSQTTLPTIVPSSTPLPLTSTSTPTVTSTPSSTATPSMSITAVPRQPTIQITRYTLPTENQPHPTAVPQPTVRPQPSPTTHQQPTAQPHPSATDDHGSDSGKETPNHS